MPSDKMFRTSFHVQCLENALYKLSKIFTKEFLLENITELIEEIYETKEK